MAKDVGGVVSTREVDPGDWGKTILEDILFRAARDISQRGFAETPVAVTMEFHLMPDETGHSIAITTPGAVEPVIRTRIAF